MRFWGWSSGESLKKNEVYVPDRTSFDLAAELGITKEELEKAKAFAEKNIQTKEHYVMAGEIKLYNPWNNEKNKLSDFQTYKRWNTESLKNFIEMALREENS